MLLKLVIVDVIGCSKFGMSLHAHMAVARKLGGRFAFELDMQSAQDTPLIRVYLQALEQWRKEHPG